MKKLMLSLCVFAISSNPLWAQCSELNNVIDFHSEEKSELDLILARKLFYAAQDGHVNEIVACLESGISPNVQDPEHFDFTAAHYAVFEERAEVLKVLKDAGADFDLKINTESARFAGLSVWNLALAANVEKTLGIVGGFSDENIDTQTFLIAAKKGKPALIERCLKKGIDVNSQDMYYGGFTALHHAVENERPDMIPFLLARGADPMIKDFSGKTAKEWAQSWDYEEMVACFP
jgi:ankyrin repeat protein